MVQAAGHPTGQRQGPQGADLRGELGGFERYVDAGGADHDDVVTDAGDLATDVEEVAIADGGGVVAADLEGGVEGVAEGGGLGLEAVVGGNGESVIRAGLGGLQVHVDVHGCIRAEDTAGLSALRTSPS